MKASPGTEFSQNLPLVYRGIVVLGAICFLLGVATGIWRIALIRGFVLAPIPDWWPPHGHFVVGGFLGGLIMFERIIALRIKWLVWVPYAYMFSAVFLHTGCIEIRVIHFVALAGWIAHRWLASGAFHIYEKPLVESLAYVTLSSALNVPGGLTAGPVVALAALSFAVATIVVERLEMSLSFRKTGARITLWLLIAWLILWNLCAWFGFLSVSWMGIVTLLVAAGTMRHDMSLWMKAGVGMHRFLRRALVVAYLWLMLAAAAMIASRYLPGAVMKDVLYHLTGLGFVFTMILAHAPLILPAAFGKLPLSRAPLAPFVMFQLLTAVRIVADLCVTKWASPWMWTGWVTGTLHLLAFVAYMALLVRSMKASSTAAA